MWNSEDVIRELRHYGKRMTRQRKIIIDVIVEKQSGDFKELFCEINKLDPNIGAATVYRMLQLLEEIGVIRRIQGYVVN